MCIFLSHYPDFLIKYYSQRIVHSWMGDAQSIVLYGLRQKGDMMEYKQGGYCESHLWKFYTIFLFEGANCKIVEQKLYKQFFW